MSSIESAALAAPVGVMGGTFDPVHLGHLRAALEVLERWQLDCVRLVPVGLPPHRPSPVAPAEARLRMLRAAVAGEPRLVVDDREVRRPGPSYTVDTLADLRTQWPGVRLCLIVGADAFLGLPTWHRWQDILALAHVIVIHRPGVSLEAEGDLGQVLAARYCDDAARLHTSAAGLIVVQAVTQFDISSTAIRALIARGGDPRFLVPDPVRDEIESGGWYRQIAEVQVRA